MREMYYFWWDFGLQLDKDIIKDTVNDIITKVVEKQW